jgi:hypothetical protein
MHNPGGKSCPAWPADSAIASFFSECRKYRYELAEIWDEDKPLVLWILMNPSVACEDYSDPTLRKTGKFSRTWDYGGQLIGNLYAYRATDKNRLLEVDDPVGPDNDVAILRMVRQVKTIVLAYGQPPKNLKKRGQEVVELLKHYPGLSFLQMAKDGKTPCHPLYLPGSLVPKPFRDIGK